MNVNQLDACETPDVVDVLIKHGADVKAASKTGFTPLVFATVKNDPKSVQTLIAAGADDLLLPLDLDHQRRAERELARRIALARRLPAFLARGRIKRDDIWISGPVATEDE